jgi:hypothetical protein
VTETPWDPVSCPAEIREEIARYEEGVDRLNTAEEQLGWLREAGLDAAIGWTEQDLAVLRGDRDG